MRYSMAGRKKKQSPLALVQSDSWKVPAFFALVVLIALFLISTFLNSSTLSSFLAPVQLVALILIGVLTSISIVKLSAQLISAYKAKKYGQHNLNPDTESPFAKTTLSEFLQRPTSWSLKVIQEIEWKRFEDLSMGYYLEKGILARSTSLGADGGVHIKLYQDDTGQPTSLVQCKSWSSRPIGVKAIREFIGVLTHEKIPKGFFMTSGEFTDDAKKTAKAKQVNLINGEMLLSMIMRLPVASQEKLLALAIAGDYKTPTCSQCGIKMISKESKRGPFWGCVNFPKCRQKLAVKKSK